MLHVLAALAATTVWGGVLFGGLVYSQHVESTYIHALAPQMFDQKSQGCVLQREAFRHSDLLPIYGSSELLFYNPYHASVLFRDYARGFSVFPVGKGGSAPLTWLQAFAAVGQQLRGRKVVLSVSPNWFFLHDLPAFYYAGNFSDLQASQFVFGTSLSSALKRRVAARMLEFPDSLKRDSFLRLAVELLADGSTTSRLLYYLLLPLGKIRNAVFLSQDHWETVTFIRSQVDLRPVVDRQALGLLDWTALRGRAEEETRQLAGANPFGFDRSFWKFHSQDVLKQHNTTTSEAALQTLRQSKQWIDLEMLLEALRSWEVKALIVSMPVNGSYAEFMGIGRDVRDTYYETLRAICSRYGFRAIDFADHDQDKWFLLDWNYHLSRKGWVYYDQALDAFFHSNNVRGEAPFRAFVIP